VELLFHYLYIIHKLPYGPSSPTTGCWLDQRPACPTNKPKDQCVQLRVRTATWWSRPPLLASGINNFAVLDPTVWLQGAGFRVATGLLGPRLALRGHTRQQSTTGGCHWCAVGVRGRSTPNAGFSTASALSKPQGKI
jgi:hypothetical protein